MKLPFHAVQVCGDILFAARGGDIHSFRLTGGAHISCWNYPVEVKKGEPSDKLVVEVSELSTPAASQDHQAPPAKRVKLDDGVQNERRDTSQGQKNGKRPVPRLGALSRPSEQPMVLILTATSDALHLVAVTQDKSIWVFEHDGQGQLKQLSRRTMPKRPCSVVLTPDNQTILSADKFGDVYSLPLIPSENPAVPAGHQAEESSPTAAAESSASPSPAPAPAPASAPAPGKATFKPQANEFTVHTKRNRQALIDQQVSATKPKSQRGSAKKPDTPQFERTLLLGHVSLLTAVTLGHDVGADGRPRQYIITADRDEHIRASRSAPQAHVIESFCLGHDEFVNRLCIPGGGEGLGGLLVSGGGDPDVFVWRWREGRLVARTPLLSLVREVVPDASKVAVTGLCCWSGRPAEGEKEATILVICERVPAIFMFTLKCAGSLEFSQTINLPGNPLEVDVVDGEKLVVAVDPSSKAAREYDLQKTLLKVEHVNGAFRVSDELIKSVPQLSENDAGVSEEQLQRLLYSAETLRKMDSEDGGAELN